MKQEDIKYYHIIIYRLQKLYGQDKANLIWQESNKALEEVKLVFEQINGRKCNVCGKIKELSKNNFYIRNNSKFREDCIECHKKQKATYREKNRNLINKKQTKQYDTIKNQYCYINKIMLLRIPYWEENNIEQILEEHLQLVLT